MPSDKVAQNSKQLVITSRAKTFLCRRLIRKRIPHPNAGAPTSGGYRENSLITCKIKFNVKLEKFES